MKRLSITFQMSIDHSNPSDSFPHNIETAETCVTLPMKDDIADDIMLNQSRSKWLLRFCGFRNVYDVLSDIANIQGYTDIVFCDAEETNKEG